MIINPAHVLGRYDRRGWARLIIAAHERWLPGVPSGAGTFCHAEAVAKAQISAAERGRTGQNYLMSGVDASFVELFGVINRVTGCPGPAARPAAGPVPPRGPRGHRTRGADRSRARGDARRRGDRHGARLRRVRPCGAGARLPAERAHDHGRGQLDLAAAGGPRAVRGKASGRLRGEPLRAEVTNPPGGRYNSRATGGEVEEG